MASSLKYYSSIKRQPVYPSGGQNVIFIHSRTSFCRQLSRVSVRWQPSENVFAEISKGQEGGRWGVLLPGKEWCRARTVPPANDGSLWVTFTPAKQLCRQHFNSKAEWHRLTLTSGGSGLQTSWVNRWYRQTQINKVGKDRWKLRHMSTGGTDGWSSIPDVSGQTGSKLHDLPAGMKAWKLTYTH